MKLSKALKVKSLLVGEIQKLQQLIHSENVQLNDNTSHFDTKKLYEQLKAKQEKLVEIKAKLASANSEIWPAVFQLVELKSRIVFLKGLNTQEGTEKTGYGLNTLDRTFRPQINKETVEQEMSTLQTEIESLQDQLDEFNHTHTIE